MIALTISYYQYSIQTVNTVIFVQIERTAFEYTDFSK